MNNEKTIKQNIILLNRISQLGYEDLNEAAYTIGIDRSLLQKYINYRYSPISAQNGGLKNSAQLICKTLSINPEDLIKDKKKYEKMKNLQKLNNKYIYSDLNGEYDVIILTTNIEALKFF